jgi:hypothetical protein
MRKHKYFKAVLLPANPLQMINQTCADTPPPVIVKEIDRIPERLRTAGFQSIEHICIQEAARNAPLKRSQEYVALQQEESLVNVMALFAGLQEN